MQSIISPTSFLQQRITLEQETEKAAKAVENARKAEQHQRLVLEVMKEVLATAARLASAESPFIGGELQQCVQADNKTILDLQACWPLYRGRHGLLVVSAVEAHITSWSIHHQGHVILTNEAFSALESHVLEAMLDELKAIAPAAADPNVKWESPAAKQGGEHQEE